MADLIQTFGIHLDTSQMVAASARGKAGLAAMTASAAKSATALLGVGAAVGGVGLALRKVVAEGAQFEQFNAQLVTVTGSQREATVAFQEMERFARLTPFALDENVQAFIRLKALGIDPTIELMTDFGNVAAGFGRNIVDIARAVQGAVTGETEALKAFGIVSRIQGEQITFAFRGVERTVNRTTGEIVGALQEIAANNFAGAMERQMDTLNGQVSNLGDNFDTLARSIATVVLPPLSFLVQEMNNLAESWQIILRSTDEARAAALALDIEQVRGQLELQTSGFLERKLADLVRQRNVLLGLPAGTIAEGLGGIGGVPGVDAAILAAQAFAAQPPAVAAPPSIELGGLPAGRITGVQEAMDATFALSQFEAQVIQGTSQFRDFLASFRRPIENLGGLADATQIAETFWASQTLAQQEHEQAVRDDIAALQQHSFDTLAAGQLIITGVGSVLSSLLAGGGPGGFFGSLLGGLGSIVSRLGPLGALVGTGLGVAGGLIGSAFGGRRDEPVKVRLEDISDRAIAKQRQEPREPVTNIFFAGERVASGTVADAFQEIREFERRTGTRVTSG